MSIDDLMSQLRQQQIFDIRDVELAILETNGSLSVYQKFQSRTPNNQLLNIPDTPENNVEPQFIVVSGGVIVKDNLELCNKDEKWIQSILKSQNQSLNNVLLMTSDKNNNYVLIPKVVE